MSNLGRMLKAVIEVQTKGTDEARQALGGVADQVEKLGRAGSDGTNKRLKRVKKDADDASKAVGVTKQQMQALQYTVNDVAASLASGSSPLTILFQQGGQLTQAFGGIQKTFATLLPYVTRFGAAIVAAGTAGTALYGLKLGSDAAESLSKLSDQADKAKLSVVSLQKLIAAGAGAGVPADEVAGGLKRVADEALRASTARSDLSAKIQEASRNAAFGVAGAAQELARLKAQKPDDIFSKLNMSLSGFIGSTKDSLPALKQLADRLVALPQGLRRDQLIADVEAKFGEGLTKVLLKGSKGIEEYSARIDALAPTLEPAAIAAAKSAQELLGVYDEAEKRAADQKGALFLPALVEFRKALLETFDSSKPILAALAKEVQVFFEVINGNRSKEMQSPFAAGFAEAVVTIATTIGRVLRVAGQVISWFYGELDKAVRSVNELSGLDLRPWAVAVVGAMALIYGPVGLLGGLILSLISYWPILSEAASKAATAVKSAWQNFSFEEVWKGLETSAEQAFNHVWQLAVDLLNRIKTAGSDALSGIGSAISSAASSVASAAGFASGGYVSGPGSGTSDSIPARLSNGEYVVRAAAVRAPGILSVLHMINGMKFAIPPMAGIPRFAAGGLVGATAGIPAVASGGRPLTLVLDGKSFSGLAGSTDAISALEKYATLRQLSATSKRAPSRIG